MRVIAGKFGSRPLRALRGMALRPTSDRLRETLFNVLGAAVEGSTFVDLFAGTGAIGIEALSRGARRVIFVENHAAAVKLIRENLELLGVNPWIRESRDSPQRLPFLRQGKKPRIIPPVYGTAEAAPLQNGGANQQAANCEAEILAMDAIRGLKQLASKSVRANFVFLDPPYGRVEEYERVLEFIDSASLLSSNGIVIVEHAKKINLPERMQSLERARVLVQGDSTLNFYRSANELARS